MKKIEDYLHLYKGCKIHNSDGRIGRLIGVNEPLTPFHPPVRVEMPDGTTVWWRWDAIKPELRPLSSATEGEMHKYDISRIRNYEITEKEVFIYGTEFQTDQGWHLTPFTDMAEITNTMRKLGFDIDGLIEAGLAIDVTTIPVTQKTEL